MPVELPAESMVCFPLQSNHNSTYRKINRLLKQQLLQQTTKFGKHETSLLPPVPFVRFSEGKIHRLSLMNNFYILQMQLLMSHHSAIVHTLFVSPGIPPIAFQALAVPIH